MGLEFCCLSSCHFWQHQGRKPAENLSIFNHFDVFWCLEETLFWFEDSFLVYSSAGKLSNRESLWSLVAAMVTAVVVANHWLDERVKKLNDIRCCLIDYNLRFIVVFLKGPFDDAESRSESPAGRLI